MSIEYPDNSLIPGRHWLNSATDGINRNSSLEFDESQFNLDYDSTSVRVSLADFDKTQGFPYGELWNFGINVNGGTITIYPGAVRVGVRFYKTAETELELTGSSLVCWNFDNASEGAKLTIVQVLGDLEDDAYLDTLSIVRGPLYYFTVVPVPPGSDATPIATLKTVYAVNMAYPQYWGPVE